MDRQDEMLALSRELLRSHVEDKQKKLMEDNLQNSELNAEYSKVVAQLVRQARKSQNAGTLGVVSYFSISHLFSSAITQTYEFKISLTNQRYFLDEKALTVYWSPKLIYDTIDADMQIFMAQARKKWVRIHPFEFDDVRRAYVNEYNLLAGMFFVGKTLNAALDAGIEDLERDDELKFLLGGHMERAVLFSTLRKAAAS